MSIEIRGAEQLAALAKALKAAGERDLQRELSKAISRATRPVKDAAKASARRTLPSRGGLADRVARSKFSTRRSARGVRVTASSPDALNRLDQGQLRHPVFGTDTWVIQPITPGWWTKPTEALRPKVQAELIRGMDEVARKIERAP